MHTFPPLSQIYTLYLLSLVLLLLVLLVLLLLLVDAAEFDVLGAGAVDHKSKIRREGPRVHSATVLVPGQCSNGRNSIMKIYRYLDI